MISVARLCLPLKLFQRFIFPLICLPFVCRCFFYFWLFSFSSSLENSSQLRWQFVQTNVVLSVVAIVHCHFHWFFDAVVYLRYMLRLWSLFNKTFMKHKNFGREKLGCVRMIVVWNEAFYDMFFVSLPMPSFFSIWSSIQFIVSSSFHIQYGGRSIALCMKVDRFAVWMDVSSKSIQRPYFSIPISFVYLCYLLGALFSWRIIAKLPLDEK